MSIPQTGTLIAGKYRLEAPLGEGGMGAVFRARHELMDKAVALKWLKPGFREDNRAEERFLQEARAAARIHHPNVVDVYDVGRHEGGLYMVMELLEGQDFASVLDAGELPFQVALRHLIAAMRGVVAAHAAGITHRDIKPENIFVAYDAHYTGGIAKILDFGISKLHDDSHIGRTGPGVAMGTPHYMSFEQMNGESDIDQRTDIYAFGVLLYRMLTGVLPFDGATPTAIMVARIHGNFRPPRELRPDLPDAVNRVVLKAMALRREDRFGTVAELIAALEQSAVLTLDYDWHAPAGGPLAAITARLPDARASQKAARLQTPGATAPNETHSAVVLPTSSRTVPLLAVGLAVVAAAALLLSLRGGPVAPAALPALPAQKAVVTAPSALPAASSAEPPRLAAPTAPQAATTPLSLPASDAGVRQLRRRRELTATQSPAVSQPQPAAEPTPDVAPAPPPAPAQPAPAQPTHRSGNLRKEDL